MGGSLCSGSPVFLYLCNIHRESLTKGILPTVFAKTAEIPASKFPAFRCLCPHSIGRGGKESKRDQNNYPAPLSLQTTAPHSKAVRAGAFKMTWQTDLWFIRSLEGNLWVVTRQVRWLTNQMKRHFRASSPSLIYVTVYYISGNFKKIAGWA